MVKLLQVVVLISGLVGCIMGGALLFSMPEGRGGAAPCMDANGEPTC